MEDKYVDLNISSEFFDLPGFEDFVDNLNNVQFLKLKALFQIHLTKTDYLTEIFRQQEQLDKHILSSDKTSFIPEIKDILFQLVDEIFEAKAHIKSKWWKVSEKESLDLFLEEMVDALHFFISALLKAGYTASDLYHGYMKKNGINHKRADSEY